jgi:hypothetical protein
MKVKFKKTLPDQGHRLTLGKEYEVLAIENGWYRILCDAQEPYLYDSCQFEITYFTHPEFWVKEIDEDGDLTASPMVWFHGYFFEDYHDGKLEFINKFWSECERLYGISRKS